MIQKFLASKIAQKLDVMHATPAPLDVASRMGFPKMGFRQLAKCIFC